MFQLFFPSINVKVLKKISLQSMGSFPNSHGKTAFFFLESGVQQEEFEFILDDGYPTYVVNVEVRFFIDFEVTFVTIYRQTRLLDLDPFATYSALRQPLWFS